MRLPAICRAVVIAVELAFMTTLHSLGEELAAYTIGVNDVIAKVGQRAVIWRGYEFGPAIAFFSPTIIA
jgi:hypothetical protein